MIKINYNISCCGFLTTIEICRSDSINRIVVNDFNDNKAIVPLVNKVYNNNVKIVIALLCTDYIPIDLWKAWVGNNVSVSFNI